MDKSSLLYFVKTTKLMGTVTDVCGVWYNSSYTNQRSRNALSNNLAFNKWI